VTWQARGLGRIFRADPRDLDLRMSIPRGTVPAKRPDKVSVRSRWIGDQGSTQACTGFSACAYMRADPVAHVHQTAQDVYAAALRLDPYSGEEDSGSTVRAAFKGLRSVGDVKEFKFAHRLDEALDFMGATKSGGVFGINWYSSFAETNSEGVVRITPRARIDGGHAIFCRGYDDKLGFVKLQNSWGHDWSLNGVCFVSYADMARLLDEDGEFACVTKFGHMERKHCGDPARHKLHGYLHEDCPEGLPGPGLDEHGKYVPK
jgi:hypothetical protein